MEKVLAFIVTSLMFCSYSAAIAAGVDADVFKDGVVDGKDWIVVVGVALYGFPIPEADINKDGVVDHLDLLIIQTQCEGGDVYSCIFAVRHEATFLFGLHHLPFDINGDGSVNVLDVISIASKISQNPYPPDFEKKYLDINRDGVINKMDVKILGPYLNYTYYTPVTAAPSPIRSKPTSWAKLKTK